MGISIQDYKKNFIRKWAIFYNSFLWPYVTISLYLNLKDKEIKS
jgi:hypothetical protein